MWYVALACDYDGTIATEGRVNEATLAALERVAASGRKLILVTGRQLDDLLTVFPDANVFNWIVAENGALLYAPSSRAVKAIAPPPPEEFVQALRERNVTPLSVGQAIVSSWQPNETVILEVIRNLGLELQIIFNKGAVMVLPSGVNKASGLAAVLSELHLSPHNVVGIGDGENDQAFLSLCECSIAVSNAVDALQKQADLVTSGRNGAGVIELADALVTTDLDEVDQGLRRRYISVGTRDDGTDALMAPTRVNLLVAGSSGAGKSTFATAVLERLSEQGYQICIIDPEGDYENLAVAVTLGDRHHKPVIDEVFQLLEDPTQSVVVNLLGLPLQERPGFLASFLPRLQEMRSSTGRPHWLLIDEAHHLLPPSWDAAPLIMPLRLRGVTFITLDPKQLASAALSITDGIVCLGESPQATISNYWEERGLLPPTIPTANLQSGEALVWLHRDGTAPFRISMAETRLDHQRHRRKYAVGDLGKDKSFYFRGPQRKLNLRAQNLALFIQLAQGVDDETWMHHLRQGDYSRWFREAIKDEELAEVAARIERAAAISPAESRECIRAAIEERYALTDTSQP